MANLDDLTTLLETTSLSKEWIKETNAKPTQIALFCIKGKMEVIAIYWEGNKGGAWDDENAVSMTNLICNL